MDDRTLRLWWGNLRMRWNCHSAAIEGGTLSYRDTLDILVHERCPQGGKPLLDVDQIRGHDQAALALADRINRGLPLALSDLHHIHTTMLVRPYPATNLRGEPIGRMVALGQCKPTVNFLQSGEVMVEFASPADTPLLIHQWCRRLQERLAILRHDPSAFDVAGVLASSHGDFIAIHPYDDGNGRMARWITNYMCLALGYPPLVITCEERARYFRCFAGLSPADVPAAPETCQPLRDFLALKLQEALQFACAVARGETDPSWDNADALLNRKVARATTYPANPLVPRIRTQDKRDQPDGTAQ